MAWPFSGRDFGLGILTGVVITVVLLFVGLWAFSRGSDVYGLGHWKLSARTPFQSMWMNLGYWKTPDGKPIKRFDKATHALLENILQAASLIPPPDDDSNAADHPSSSQALAKSVSILDVGFGCGDQIIALTELIQAHRRSHFRYVGLTLNTTQLSEAHRRLRNALRPPSSSSSSSSSDSGAENDLSNPATRSLSHDAFSLFRADAAKPDAWPKPIHAAVDSLADAATYPERWFLGLDTLYHFSPSRQPIFTLAAQTLDANLMAFDLILSDDASALQTAAVRLLGYALGCPMRTFLTETQYRAQMVQCGYDGEHIEVRDVSDCVFAGLAGFLQAQDAALSPYGIYMGGYKLVGRVYEWFDRTRVVKAAIVIGRTKKKDL